MTKDAFIAQIRAKPPLELCRSMLLDQATAVFKDPVHYDAFKKRVLAEVGGQIEGVHIAGSAKWGYSLNPRKNLRPFNAFSDIDIAVISDQLFRETWEEIRKHHRLSWYMIDLEGRARLRRNGENIYSGFVSPVWIPDRTSSSRFTFIRMLNRLSDVTVAHRKVTALYFRNVDEAIDYYQRGFTMAKNGVAA